MAPSVLCVSQHNRSPPSGPEKFRIRVEFHRQVPIQSHLSKSRDREQAYQLLGGCEVFAHRIAFEDFALRPEDGVRTVEIDCPWIKGPTPLLIVQDSKDEWKNVFVKVAQHTLHRWPGCEV